MSQMAEGHLPAPDPPDVRPLRGSDAPVPGRCGSPLPARPGRFCTQFPLIGKTRCKKHGGPSLSGIAHPNFKHGRYSKSLGPLRRQYLAHRNNPEYLHSLDEIALNQSRITQLLERLPSGEAGRAWKTMGGLIKTLVVTIEEFDAAMAKKDMETARAAIRGVRPLAGQMQDATNEGLNESAGWGEINGQLIIHTKLVAAETKRRQVDEQSMPANDVFVLVAAITGAFADVVVDRDLRRLFTDRVQALIGPSSGVIDTAAVVKATA